MPKHEIKPSFSFKYFLLLSIASIISASITYFFTNFFYSSPSYDITLSEYFSGNLVQLDPQVKAEVITQFRLKKQPKEILKAFYKYEFTIKNIDNEGIENLKIIVGSNKDANLIEPTITSNPKSLMKQNDFVKRTFNNNMKNEWLINLLNKGESIKFEYVAYSSNLIENIKFYAIARAKNLRILKENYQNDTTILFFIISIACVTLFLIVIDIFNRSRNNIERVNQQAYVKIINITIIFICCTCILCTLIIVYNYTPKWYAYVATILSVIFAGISTLYSTYEYLKNNWLNNELHDNNDV